MFFNTFEETKGLNRSILVDLLSRVGIYFLLYFGKINSIIFWIGQILIPPILIVIISRILRRKSKADKRDNTFFKVILTIGTYCAIGYGFEIVTNDWYFWIQILVGVIGAFLYTIYIIFLLSVFEFKINTEVKEGKKDKEDTEELETLEEPETSEGTEEDVIGLGGVMEITDDN